MKTKLKKRSDELRPEYDFNYSKATRGKYARRYSEGTNVVVLDPDVAEYFPDHESVNESLRSLVSIIKKRGKTKQK
jgi:hypothetical protein